MEETPSNQNSAKKKALARDGFRCVVTGQYDYTTFIHSEELKQNAGNTGAVSAECAYILGESVNEECASNDWAIAKRFGYETLPDDLSGPLIHRLENVMTLCSDIQFKFDRLDLWFVETPEPHRYKLEVAYPKASPGLPKYVTFTTPDKDKLPLPSPAFLKLHAACCKIARLSGASKYVWKFYTDMKDTHVLAHDGSTARLLEEALLYTPSRPRLFETADTLSWLISVNPLSKQGDSMVSLNNFSFRKHYTALIRL